MCYIAPGQTGACDRYGNVDGRIVRSDPLTVLDRTLEAGGAVVPFSAERLGRRARAGRRSGFVTGIGAGTTYPDYKPAPFIVSREVEGADVVTVVTEAIFSYCGVKVKIDTDRHLGPERAVVRADGEAVGHVTTAEYGSQMLSLGGVEHLTGGSKAEGRATCAALLALCNREPVELADRRRRHRHRRRPAGAGGRRRPRDAGCASAAARPPSACSPRQWRGLVDEVVVVDDHITGVVSEHQAGKVLGWQPTGIRIRGHRSTPGRYFQVSEPGLGWGGTRLDDPLEILAPFEARARRAARPDACSWSRPPASSTPTTCSTTTSCRSRRPLPAALGADGRAHRRELRAVARHRPLRRRRRRLAPRRRHRQPGAPDPRGAGPPRAAHLRRRAGLRLAGRRHHLHGRRHPAAATAPSATCRPRRWSRRSSSPCPAPTTSRSAATPPRSARSTTSWRAGGEYTAGEPALPAAMTGPQARLAARRPPPAPAATARST